MKHVLMILIASIPFMAVFWITVQVSSYVFHFKPDCASIVLGYVAYYIANIVGELVLRRIGFNSNERSA